MEENMNKRREIQNVKHDVVQASLERLIQEHDEFFNFVNLNEGWYRWVSGKYTVTNIDSMGETLIENVTQYCKDLNVGTDGHLCTERILVLDYKGVLFLLRKLDGKEDFSAISIIDNPGNFRMIFWDKLQQYLEKKLERLKAEAELTREKTYLHE